MRLEAGERRRDNDLPVVDVVARFDRREEVVHDMREVRHAPCRKVARGRRARRRRPGPRRRLGRRSPAEQRTERARQQRQDFDVRWAALSRGSACEDRQLQVGRDLHLVQALDHAPGLVGRLPVEGVLVQRGEVAHRSVTRVAGSGQDVGEVRVHVHDPCIDGFLAFRGRCDCSRRRAREGEIVVGTT